jgi:hypothetical protein
MLVACGERAVRTLRDYLLYGKPSSIFMPCQRAVRALAELGAKDILLEYVAAKKSAADLVVAHGEEAAKRTAARASGPRLAALLYDNDAEIAARTAMITLRIADHQPQMLAIRRLIEGLPSADWLLQSELKAAWRSTSRLHMDL